MLMGLVLCGGQSSRMGHDKGLKLLGPYSWAQRTSTLLHAVTSSVVISINADQLKAYTSLQQQANGLAERECLLLADDVSLPVGGPLKGILSAHRAWPQADWLVLACDMVLMKTEVLQNLCNQAATYAAEEAFVYGSPEQAQPLCGIYSSRALQLLTGMVQSGSIKKSSMHQALAMLRVHYVPVKEHMQPCFTNCNTQEDIAAITAAMESIQF